MGYDQPDMHDLRERLEKLERENRRMRKLVMSAAVVAVAIVSMGQAHPSRTIEGEKFVLRDSQGKTRAELGMISGGFPSLQFYDPDGTFRSSFSSELLSLMNGQVTRTKFKDNTDPSKGVDYEDIGGPQVTLSQAGLMVWENVKGNGPRHVFFSLGWVPGPGSPYLHLYSQASSVEMTASDDGPYLTITDAQRFSSVFGTSSQITPSTGETHKTSAASIAMFDKDGHQIWSAPVQP